MANVNKDYLKLDPTYKAQSAALTKARKDYVAQQNTAKTGYLTNYSYDTNSYNRNRKAAVGDNQNDYAARGMMNSGLYADSIAKQGNEWDQKKAQIELAKRQYLAGLKSDLANFTTQQQLTNTQAEQEAAARRALRLGI
jgi:hypothetical protein